MYVYVCVRVSVCVYVCARACVRACMCVREYVYQRKIGTKINFKITSYSYNFTILLSITFLKIKNLYKKNNNLDLINIQCFKRYIYITVESY